jgi:peptide-methionine (R)-S-oxide reductase
MTRGVRIFALLAILAVASMAFSGGGRSTGSSNRGGGVSVDSIEKGESATARSNADWQEILEPMQYYVTRQKGTERAFSGAYWNTKTPGVYRCVCCDAPLFSSETKYDSGTGWPSFYQPHDKANVATQEDDGWFVRRTEVLCGRCDAHLGHVFEDGPEPTGLRYCVNSAALKLDPSTPVGREE